MTLSNAGTRRVHAMITMNAKPDRYRAAELVERAYSSAPSASTSADTSATTRAPATVARRYTFAFDRWLPASDTRETGQANAFVWA